MVVTEELHFTRAAARLGIAQPPLSRAVRALERRLGVPLLDRSPRGVTLTAAGRTLLDEARVALDAVAAAVARTRRAAAGPLVVTAKPGVAGDLLHRIVQRYAAAADRPAVEIVVSPYRQQTRLLHTGRADLASCTPRSAPAGSGRRSCSPRAGSCCCPSPTGSPDTSR